MREKIHKFRQNGLCLLLDVNSGAVHVIDDMIYDIMDTFDGSNDAAVISTLGGRYPEAELREALGELHELIAAQALFAPDLDVPPTFAAAGLVKSMCLMVAHDCNLRCRYCFGDTGEYGGDRQLMSREVGEAAIDYIIAHSGARIHCEVDFFGGEPLVNMPVVEHITAYVRQREKETGKRFKLTLTTNGLLLDEKKQRFLDDHNISLVLSLDGRREVHDRMRGDWRGQGTYDRVLPNFQRTVAARGGQNYYLRGTYTKYDLDFTQDVLAMYDAGFTVLSMEPVVAKDAPYAIEEADLPRIYEEYERLAEVYLEHRRAGKGFSFFHFNLDLAHGPCVAKRLAGCGAGHEYYAVAANGDLYPCHQFVGRQRYRLGSVFEGVTETELPPYFRESHVLNKPLCHDCWARFFCSGGCHANADLFHGNIREPYEIGCAIQKKRLECAIMVQAALAAEQGGQE